MRARATAVLDIGKTHTRLTLWVPGGRLLHRQQRANDTVRIDGRACLDTAGIEQWLIEALTEFARTADIGAIIPIAHGAAAAVIRNGALACPVLDYEQPIPASLRREYDAQRDPFSATGSPALPQGLNLGAQLHYLEANAPSVLADDATVLPWPQYWAWLLSGVAASEVTSLGCHTDLWRPMAQAPSALSAARGWAACMAPLVAAGDVLGAIKPEWSARTGLPGDVAIHCGLHDSNAALLAARSFQELATRDATVLSTGTWFIAMRSLGRYFSTDIASLAEDRDCLINVDAFGKPVPSARFMGGREIELLTGTALGRVDARPDQAAIHQAISSVLASGAMVLPTWTPGCGPFPRAPGRWLSRPTDVNEQRAAICLYAALLSDVALELVGAHERVLVEGRFSGAEVFVRALATLRSNAILYTHDVHHDASFGALCLVDCDLPPQPPLRPVAPLEYDLSEYRRQWRELADAQLGRLAR